MTATATRERPIIFSAHSVRAILAGEKNQTRRLVKPSAYQLRYTRDKWGGFDSPVQANQAAGLAAELSTGQGLDVCPHGQAGDRLWVRETWRPGTVWSWRDGPDDPSRLIPIEPPIVYRADGEDPDDHWRSALFLRRADSRLILSITEVRVERLCAITEADARAEGYGDVAGFMRAFVALNDPQDKIGWWRVDPWVWVITLARVLHPETFPQEVTHGDH